MDVSLWDRLADRIFTEYGLAVLVLGGFVFFMVMLVHLLNRERIKDREERIALTERFMEASGEFSAALDRNTQAAHKNERTLTYISGLLNRRPEA